MTVKHAGSTVSVSWQKVMWANGYDVVLVAESGMRKRVHVTGTKVAIKSIAAWQAGTVKVVATRSGFGRSGAAKLLGKGKAPTRFLPYSELTKA